MADAAAKAERVAALIARIKATDDFYKVLGVERDADDAAIKKAYRKAALQLHPDKCQLGGAKEAFQKLSSAFGCLSNSDERAFYDRTGRERASGGGGGGRSHAESEEAAREMFKQFFGADFDIKAWEEGGMEIDWGLGRFTPPAALFPVLLCLFLWYFLGSTNPGRGEVQFRLSPQGQYQVLRESLQQKTPYYVDQYFEKAYTSRPTIKKFEKEVDKQYVSHLMGSCRQERGRETRARFDKSEGGGARNSKEQMPSCVELERRGYEL